MFIRLVSSQESIKTMTCLGGMGAKVLLFLSFQVVGLLKFVGKKNWVS